MSDETPRRTIIGMFPSGAEIVAFQPVEAALIADAAARLDAEKAEAERAARQNLTVNREWFLVTMRALLGCLESDRRFAARRGNTDRSYSIAGQARRLREDVDATLAYNEAKGLKP